METHDFDETRLEPADMAKVPFLAGLLPAEVEALCGVGTLKHYRRADDVVFRKGDTGQELYVLIEGEVAIEIEAGGVRRTLAALGPGTVFGEINYLLGSERTATARVLRPTRVLSFRREALESLAGIGRQAAVNMLETIARVLALRLTRMDHELSELCTLVARECPALVEQATALDTRRDRLRHDWP